MKTGTARPAVVMMLYVKARMQPETWRSNPDLALALNPDFGILEFDEEGSTLRPPAAGCAPDPAPV